MLCTKAYLFFTSGCLSHPRSTIRFWLRAPESTQPLCEASLYRYSGLSAGASPASSHNRTRPSLFFFGLTKWLQNAHSSQTLAFLSCLYLHIGVSHLTTASSKSSRCPYKATRAIGQGAILLSVCRKKTEMKQNPPNNQNNSPEVTGFRLIGSREDLCRVLCLSTKQTLHNQLGLLQAWDLGTDLI